MSDILRLSRWFPVSPALIEAFADLTQDRQFIHVDAERAAQTRFGGPVAHGFLTLSLLSAMAYDAIPRDPDATGVNYGFDRLRFLQPVRPGQRVRGRFRVIETTPRGEGVLTRLDVVVEIEGLERPALAAEWLTLSLKPAG